VGLPARELAELLDQLDGPDPHPSVIKRDFVRWPFRRASIAVRLVHPGGACSTLAVACRNISRGGMGVLHNAYMHPGTRVTVTLPHPGRGALSVDGWVARCHHRSGIIHEVGIAFAEPLDVRDLLRPGPLEDHFSLERVRPEDLVGAILCADSSEMEQRMMRHFLRDTRLRVRSAATGEEAVSMASDTWDVILIDTRLRGRSGMDAAREIRARAVRAPVILMTADTQAPMRAMLSAAHAHAFLAKPLTQQMLLRALAEFLIAARQPAGAIVSSVAPGHPDAHLVGAFVHSMRSTSKRLEDAIRRDDGAACRALCQQVATTAPGAGFRTLGDMAAEAAASLNRAATIGPSFRYVRALIAACERARTQSRPAA
jgi:twitching motility two-component system response regulator PilH